MRDGQAAVRGDSRRTHRLVKICRTTERSPALGRMRIRIVPRPDGALSRPRTSTELHTNISLGEWRKKRCRVAGALASGGDPLALGASIARI